MKRLLVLILLLASAGWVVAGDRNKGSRTPAIGPGVVETKDAGAVVPSGVVEKRVVKLNDKIHWYTSLDEAKIQHVFYESSGTDHEWQTWRRDLQDFAPRLFQGPGRNAVVAQKK